MPNRLAPTRPRRAAATMALLGVGLLLSSSVGALSQTWTTDVDFTAGTPIDVVVDADRMGLGVEGVGEPDGSIAWWDAAWGQRRCIDVTNNDGAALNEFQLTLSVDTATSIAGGRMNVRGDDIRFIASDNVTELDHWIEGPIDDAATTIWVQTDTLPVGASTLCMYYDNPAAGPMSDPYAPFTYATPQPLYVAVSETQANRAVAVTSYVADNEISDGITTTTIGAGDVHTFPAAGHTAATVISATGPLALQGVGSGSDTYVPLAFAGTEFVVASTRNANRLSLYAPFADAAVTIEHSGTTTNVVVPVGASVSVGADVTSNAEAAVVTSTEPILVTHVSGGFDAFVALPASDAPLYGVRSTQHITGFGGADTAVSIDESDGTHLFVSGVAASAVARSGGGSQGTGPAVLVTPAVGGSISSTQQADSDGGESTSFWPLSEMNIVYRTPVAAEYVAVACPVQGTGNIDSGGTVLDCTGTGGAPFPGKARAAGGLGAGDLFESLDGTPFYVYVEDGSDDETNVLGPKQARLVAADPPTSVIGPEESPYVSPGTWTSPVGDAGCGAIYTVLSWNPATQPANADVVFQFATASALGGPFDFVGPDGTNTSFYDTPAGTPIAAPNNGDRYFQVQATLSSTDLVSSPTIDDVTVGFDGQTTIDGRLFGDVAGDGSGAGDPGLDGIDVTLWLDDGDGVFGTDSDTAVVTLPSSAGGVFEFVGQPPGAYFVVADETQLPPGYMSPATAPNPAGPIVVVDCATASIEIGWQLRSSVMVTVFSDVDAEGTLSGTDVVVPGIDVALWSDDGDGVFDPGTDTRSATGPSDADGIATFVDLPIGDYFAFVPSAPAEHDGVATTSNPAGPLSIVDAASVSAAIGFKPLGTLGGTAFSDLDGDGTGAGIEPAIADLVVAVYLDDGDGVFDPALDTVERSLVTDSDGNYTATGLASGVYWSVPDAPPAPNIAIEPVIAEVVGGQVTTRDLPFRQTPVGVLRGTAFSDLDGDGVRTASEPGVPELVITVTRDNGDGLLQPGIDSVVTALLTDADGVYDVPDLAPGSYWVVAGEAPAPNLAGDPVLVEVATGLVTVHDLPFAQSIMIAGVVIVDADATVGDDSVGLGGMTVTLFVDDGDGVLDRATDGETFSTSTNSAGEFAFPDLPPEGYLVELTGTSPVLTSDAIVIGANPLGPVVGDTTDLVFAFHPDSLVQLPATGATAVRAGLTIGSLLVIAGLALVMSGRRRSVVPTRR